MIVLLEGPDGTGKSTLANAVRLRLPYTCKIIKVKYRFGDKMHLYHWAILRKAVRLQAQGFDVVIDRLWPSELIYGSVYRGAEFPVDYFDMMDKACQALGVVTVFCLPHDFDKFFERFERLRQERDEMYELDDRFKQMTYAYVNLYNEMAHRFDVLRYTIEEHGRKHRSGRSVWEPGVWFVVHRILRTNSRLNHLNSFVKPTYDAKGNVI